MALQDDAPYKQSRAALRRIYGSRSIDASAPQSARDTTPSGRARRMEQEGLSATERRDESNAVWQKQFRQRGNDIVAAPQEAPPAIADATVRPLDLMRRRTAPQSPLDAIEQARTTGASSVVTQTPYGKIGFGADAGNQIFGPKLMPDSPIAGIGNYLGSITRTSNASLFPSLRQPRKPSILDGAEKWLKTV